MPAKVRDETKNHAAILMHQGHEKEGESHCATDEFGLETEGEWA
jgi:hypothetical protein